MRIIALLILALSFSISACDGQSSGGNMKIAAVDLTKLLRDSEPGKAALKLIETRQNEIQGKLEELQQKLEKNPSDESALQELQAVYASSQQQIQAEGQNLVGQLYDAVQTVMDKYRKDNNYMFLLRTEAIESMDPSLDVTGKVLEEVNKLKIDFKTLPEEKINDAAASEESKKPDNGKPSQEKPAAN